MQARAVMCITTQCRRNAFVQQMHLLPETKLPTSLWQKQYMMYRQHLLSANSCSNKCFKCQQPQYNSLKMSAQIQGLQGLLG